MRESVLLCSALLFSLTAMATDAPPPAFDEARLRLVIQTLSSDAYGGRAPGSASESLTTDYIATKFKQYGLAGADHGAFLQEVPMLQITADPKVTLAIASGAAALTLAYGDDMVISTARPEPLVSLKGSPLVFAGYGVVAPEYGWDDYAGLDVKGKTVVVLVNDPGHADPALFDGKAMTYYGRWTYKYEEAARHGAAGILIVHDTEPAGYPWEVVRSSWTGPLEELPPGKAYRTAIQGWLTHDAAERLFAAAGLKLDGLTQAAAKHGFKAIPLKLSLNVTLHNQVKSIISHNVVGLVRGAKHPDDVVVYSAHWDHLGQRVGTDGKPEIYHGAADNASGIAGLLEIARVTAQAKPERSVLFLATTSEEQGLLGAEYYTAHPLFPLKHTVADLNMDVLDTFGKTRDETVRGKFMSGVDEVFIAQARDMGLAVEQDAQPEKGMYFRADHFEFAKVGVPAMSIALGTDYADHPAGWGLDQQRAYTSTRYHKPADVYSADWDLTGMLQQVELMYLTGRKLADSSDWPAWRPGMQFEAARKAEKQ